MIASLIGVISVWKKLGKLIENNLHFLVSFSAGVFSFVSYHLIKETLLEAKTIQYGLLWIIIGGLIIYLLFKLLPNFHHHHDNQMTEHIHSPIDARKIILGDGIHNIADGLLLVSSFTINLTLGITATLSIFVHEIIQEISEFFVLRQAGYSIKKSLLINLITSSTILIGSLGGFLLLNKFIILEIPLLGIAAGSFIMVIIQDLIPHSIEHSTNKSHIYKHLAWFTLGLALMFILSTISIH